MKRVIVASGFDRYGGTPGYENMTDDQILWEEMKDAWQDACERWYNAILDAEDPRNLTRDQIIIYVSDHARVKYDIAAYFVDQFLSWEPEPLPLKASTDINAAENPELIDDYLWEVVYDISGITNICLAELKDTVIVDFERCNPRMSKTIENQLIDVFESEGYDVSLVYNTGTEVVLRVLGLEDSKDVTSSSNVNAAFGFGKKSKKNSKRNNYAEIISDGVNDIVQQLQAMASGNDPDERKIQKQAANMLQASLADIEDFLLQQA